MKAEEFDIDRLGECTVQSPMQGVTFTPDDELVLYHSRLGELQSYLDRGERLPAFEMAGARQRIFFDPTILNCGIVTCGGLCPGLNDVIRSEGIRFQIWLRGVGAFLLPCAARTFPG